MLLKDKYKEDITFIMSKRHFNGGDLWTDANNSIGKGSPFSTRDVAIILTELGFSKKDAIIKKLAGLIFTHQQPDGRFKISESSSIYPCHTISSLRALCYLGYAKDNKLKKTFEYLISNQENDGGWKCNKFSFGKGPETNHSNPAPTLEALDSFRFTNTALVKKQTDKAIEFLLWHWEIKKPIGPCLFGMGNLFNQIEYPFLRYNLFYFTYVLSFYNKAIRDKRFKEAYKLLLSKLQNDQIIVENPNRQLSKMELCFKGKTSELATKRFKEIQTNEQRYIRQKS